MQFRIEVQAWSRLSDTLTQRGERPGAVAPCSPLALVLRIQASHLLGRRLSSSASTSGSSTMVWPASTSDTRLNLALALSLCILPLYLTLRLPLSDSAEIIASYVGNVLVYAFVVHTIGKIKHNMLKRNLSGKDLNKAGAKEDKPDVPEALGLVSGVVFTFAGLGVITWLHFKHGAASAEGHAALVSILVMTACGFIDDLFDLRWRWKLIIPAAATLPLLLAYNGSTYIAVPNVRILTDVLGTSINLGVLYYAYMGLLAIFTTNAINIYAGCNGLEAGQSLIIAFSILVHNLIELDSPQHANHLLSIFLIVPFIAATAGLLHWNWYPSSVFVGDTFCYFAGMTFACVGILGHFSKTLLLFFVPQIINFVYSLPQILHLFGITCPRHRLPRYDPKTDKLVAIPSNHNLINLFLLFSGPQHEKVLVRKLLVLQVVCSALAFFVRYQVAAYFYTPGATKLA
jgi:UDP-N-acetylglucosamine--dolichyl-phosphate N-acetylglucosaminephosphotransferase